MHYNRVDWNRGRSVSLEIVKKELESRLPDGWSLSSLEEGMTSPNEGRQPFFCGTFKKPDISQLSFVLKAKGGQSPTGKVLLCESPSCAFFIDMQVSAEEKASLASSFQSAVTNLNDLFYVVGPTPTLPPPFPHPPLGGAPPLPQLPPPELARPYVQPEQGCEMTCPYCEHVRDAGPTCPLCKGQRSYFHPAQMMDRNSSFRRVVASLTRIVRAEDEAGGPADKEAAKVLRRKYIALLEELATYSFSAMNFVVARLKAIESEFGVE